MTKKFQATLRLRGKITPVIIHLKLLHNEARLLTAQKSIQARQSAIMIEGGGDKRLKHRSERRSQSLSPDREQ